MEIISNPERLQGITIEQACPEDALGILMVQKLTWLATYPNQEAGVAYADIETFVSDWDSTRSVEQMRNKIVSQAENSLHLVAKARGTVVGQCLATKDDSENKLHNLYVLPGYQGNGVGRHLISQAMYWLGTEKNITLEVVRYNTPAIDFYKKLGFVVASVISHEDLSCGARMPGLRMVKPVGEMTAMKYNQTIRGLAS